MGTSGAYGGWFHPDKEPPQTPHNVHWFTLQGTLKDLPADLQQQGGTEAQRIIGGLETLAQIGLMIMRNSVQGIRGKYVDMEQLGDSMTALGAVNKIFSTKEPLASYLWVLAEWCTRSQTTLRVSHIPGQNNGWADILSRSSNPAEELGLDKNREFSITLQDITRPSNKCKLLPSVAQWPAGLAQLQA